MDTDPRKPPTGRKKNRRMKAKGRRSPNQRRELVEQGKKAQRAYFEGHLTQTAYLRLVKGIKADLDLVGSIGNNLDERRWELKGIVKQNS